MHAFPGTVLSLVRTGSSRAIALLVDGGDRGTLTVCCHDRSDISVHAMPRSWSAIHTMRSVREHVLTHITLGELAGLLERYWGRTPV